MARTPQGKTTRQFWPPSRDDWFPGFSAHRDGWVRSYLGQTLFCGGRTATRDEVEATYQEKKKAVDEGAALLRRERTYRQVLGEFLTVCEARVRTGKPRRMRPRTLHNYDVLLNQFGEHVGGSTAFSQTNNPAVFSDFARRFGDWKSSGFDSVVTRIGALYNWAVEMEYIDRYRPGPQFQRPDKQELRDERLDLSKSFGA
jgi:hypothetical protein